MQSFREDTIKTQNSVMEITVYMFFCYGKNKFMTIFEGGLTCLRILRMTKMILVDTV